MTERPARAASPRRGVRWLMVGLVATSPLLLFASWAMILEEGLPEPFNSIRMLLDLVLGIVSLALVPQVFHRDSGPPAWAVDERRERRALGFGVATILLSSLSGMAVAAGIAAFVSLAARRRGTWLAAAVGALAVGIGVELVIGQSVLWWQVVLAFLVLATVLVLLGLYRGSRRDLLRSLRREADAARLAAEATQHRAREEERTRIAREMHDTVSHRLALVAVHAGALEFRDDLTPEQVREAAGVIRQGVQDAADELRATLAVLRTDPADTRPAPTLDDLRAMVDDVRATGAIVWLDAPAGDAASGLATGAAAHVHRVVQEALTNAVKHAPRSPIRVVVADEEGGVRVEVRNALPRVPVAAPGSRVGLVGLRERVALVGGTFWAGAEAGEFVVRAWVPWKS